MNRYLQEMKNALSGFYNKAKEYERNVEQARQRYQPDIAAEEIKKFDSSLEADKRAAINTITDAKDQGIQAAQRWAALDGSNIDDGDMKLLKFDLSPDQFAALVDKHRNNGTMCFILKQYAEKHSKQEQKDGEFLAWDSLSSVDVPTVEEKIKAYNQFAESAIATVNNMTGYGWGKGVSNPVIESSVKNFGTPNQFDYKWLEVW